MKMEEGLLPNSESIYHILKNEILSLTLKPGQSMSENELCRRFSVSRTPVRTALQRLQATGLVKVIPYKGSVVTLLNFEDIQQMIYMRVAVESKVIRDFIDTCTPIFIEKLRYIIRKQTVLLENQFEVSRFYEMDSQFHRVWFKATHKEKLWALIQRSQVNYTRFRMLDIVAVQNFSQIVEEHKELFSIIEKQQKQAVEPLIEKHMYGGIHRLGDRIHTEFQDYFQPQEAAIW